MKILGIDSSGLVASVALVEDDRMIAEYSVNFKKTHSQTLLPMLDEISKMVELDLGSVDAIAIAKGPGSFTGLRIGSATVKGLGFYMNKPIAEVTTTEALAYNMYGTDRIVCPLMDARREQVYTGIYEFIKDGEHENLNVIEDVSAVGIEEIIGKLNSLNRPVVFLGDGVAVYKDKIREFTKVDYIFASQGSMGQRASSVAALGLIKVLKGDTVSADRHVPEYLRLSQAERERNEAAEGAGNGN